MCAFKIHIGNHLQIIVVFLHLNQERGRSLSDQEYENIFAAVIEHAIEEPQQVTSKVEKYFSLEFREDPHKLIKS